MRISASEKGINAVMNETPCAITTYKKLEYIVSIKEGNSLNKIRSTRDRARTSNGIRSFI
jgi:hypothetical protein